MPAQSTVRRQREIMDIVSTTRIETIDEIVDYLIYRGFETTAATVRKDIEDLGLVKVKNERGQRFYFAPPESFPAVSIRFEELFGNAVADIGYANNIVGLKTFPGVEGSAAQAVNSIRFEGVLGVTTGPSFCSIICSSNKRAKEVAEYLSGLLR